MAEVLTEEQVTIHRKASREVVDGFIIREVLDSHEALRAERDEARRELAQARAEYQESWQQAMGERDRAILARREVEAERDEWREQSERAEAALRELHARARAWGMPCAPVSGLLAGRDADPKP